MSIKSRSQQYGKVFDHWQIKEFLGSGSGGKTAVFRLVRSDSAWGVSALKVVNLIEERGDIHTLPDFRRKEYEAARDACSEKAEQEVRFMDDLRGNTNIVDYLDHTFVDWSDDSGFGRDLLIRMELLQDLRSDIQDGKIFSELEALKIGRDICIALILCHRKDILHRDVKPENIFRNKDGNYKLGDFGVSRVLDACPGASASTGIGTYEYWPAEQMTGKYDKRVDIYSLGLVLYELCNRNRLPFAASTYVTRDEVSMRLSGMPLPEPSNASPALRKVILKACAPKPEDRCQSAEEFLKAMNRVIRGIQASAHTDKPSQPQKKVRQDDYATVYAKEDSANGYKTEPAKPAKRGSFETQPARARTTDYQTLPAEQSRKYVTQKKRKKQSKPTILLLGAIALCLVFLIGVMSVIGKLSFYSNEPSHVHTTLASTASETTQQTETTASVETVQLPVETTIVETTLPTIMPTENPVEVANREQYARAEALLAEGKNMHAALIFRELGDYRDSAQRSFDIQIQMNPTNATISAGGATVALKSDGTAIATGGDNNYNQWYVYNWDWKDIVSISAGGFRTVALCADGTVVNAGWSDQGKYSTGSWSNIIAVAAGKTCALGLKEDGTVVVTGPNYRGENDVGSWRNIVAISAGIYHNVGLKSDGTLVAAGYNGAGQCDVSDWSDIVAISAGGILTVGLKADGTVVSTKYDTSDWVDIIAVSAGVNHIVGLKSNGTVVAVGSNSYGESDVGDWTNIVAISADDITLGLRSDGTVVAVGGYDSKQRDVGSWSDIRLPEWTILGSAENMSISIAKESNVSKETVPLQEMQLDNTNTVNYLYTGTVIRTDSAKMYQTPSISATVESKLSKGDSVIIYETTIAEDLAWGRCDAGWVYLYYVDLAPATGDAVDARVVYSENAVAYTDIKGSAIVGTYPRMSVIDIYEINGKMARTDLGWVNTDSLG